MDGFARREFQLVLLRRMADYQPDLVMAAARSLDATRTEMRQVNARWQRMLRSMRFPGGERRLRGVLGPPAAHADRRLGDVICQAAWWELPLWPDLRFEALIGPDGSILLEWLVRPETSQAPRLDGVADLAPWSCVVGDVAMRFAPVQHHADTVPSRWHVVFSPADGAPSRVAHFVWGLLQTVEDVPPQERQAER
ncbi:hypothetical protein [Actinomadura sp. HBU206391]|uniref:hypothetical protein n=1 Tax=Actinomadura sp. HBU206391 TaxID=2731692 RepID=UPI0016502A3A|nr:hypothetical protein [Actinomadura sp. HBU206391]MBC6458989.1 hypothetical protein [Actinomadura sp. HBU206391]